MGTIKIKSNLGKISKICCGNKSTRWIFFAVIALGLNVEFANSSEGNDTTVTTSQSSPTQPYPYETIVLNQFKVEEQWKLRSDAKPTIFKIEENAEKAGFKIAIHLMKCDFDESESLKITTSDGKKVNWECPQRYRTIEPTEVFIGTDMQTRNDERSVGQYVEVEAVLDDITEVEIIPNWNISRKWKGREKATIIINIYKDVNENRCPDDMFNCRQTPCPPTCCSELQQLSSEGSQAKLTPSATIITTSTLFSTPAFWKAFPRSSNGARCIPSSLKCNDNPNCGVLSNNIDESNQICYPLKYCDCQSICLTWNYVLTSLAIAVLFIITPTAIVFALFHRRNVALERARLLRMAAMRMADMRGEFTRDDPHNDRPPTYDEVYDIKEPPPCFCKAIAMQREYDLQQQMLSSNSDTENQESRNRIGDEGTSEQTVIENEGSIEFQNLGFQCSCTSVNREDIPPSYMEVNSSSSSSCNEEGENENNRSNNSSQQPQQINNNNSSTTVNANYMETGMVDMGKDEEV